MCFSETTRGAAGSPLPLAFSVPDPADPARIHIVRGTVFGIQALQALLKQRFQDGQEVGRVSAVEAEEMGNLILKARIGELEAHQREDVAMIRQAAESLGLATEVIRRYQVVFRAARALQRKSDPFGEDWDGDPDAAAQALFAALDEFKVPERGARG